MITIAPYTDTSRTKLYNARLIRVLRIIGWLLFACSVGIIIVNIPWFYQWVIDGVENSPTLVQTRIPPELFAVVRSVIRRFGELCFLLIATVILIRSRDFMALLIAMMCTLFATSLSGATIEVIGTLPPDNPALLPFRVLMQIMLITSVVIGALVLFTLPNGEFVPGWSRYLLIAFAIATSVLFSWPVPLGLIAYIPVFPVLGIGIAAQIHRYRYGTSIYQHQFKWMIWGSSIAFVLTLMGQLAYIAVPRDFHILTMGLDEIGAVFLSVCLIIAITRYRLYDINLFIHRSLVFVAVAVALGLLFILQFVVVKEILQSVLKESSPSLSLLIPAMITGALFNPARYRIQNVIDRQFYRLRFNLHQLEEKQRVLAYERKGRFIGSTIADYTLTEMIGRGGMGEVYKGVKNGSSTDSGKTTLKANTATNNTANTAAVKILTLDYSLNDEVFQQRFKREAQMTAALNHPHIVKLYDYGEQGGLYYLLLEYIEGQSLDAVLKASGKLTLNDIRPIIAQVAEALDTAHTQGFVHRDIKPANIILRRSRRPEEVDAVLTDFGVAKMIGGGTDITGSDAVGTVQYMAPEQIEYTGTIDHRADIYALGVVLYELLTGEAPFTGNPAQILFAHLHQPAPNPASQFTNFPMEAAAAIMRAMAKHPDERFATASELVQSLQ